MIFLSSTYTYDAYKNNKNMEEIELIAELSTLISSLVHETQKERGLSAGLIGNKGSKFKNELTTQKKLTDKKI